MINHTPGPWKLCANEQGQDFQIVGANSLPVATMQTAISSASAKWYDKKHPAADLWSSVASETEAANARLIAAAPDLLAALQEVVAISDRKHDAWDRAHAAIAKAK